MGGKPMKDSEYAVPIKSDEECKNQGPIMRSAVMPDKLLDNTDPPLHSVYEVFKRARDNFPKNRCFGKKVTPEKGDAQYEWLSYQEADQLITKTGSLIMKKGFLSDEFKFVAIVAPNRNEWMIADLAINMVGGTSVPFYQALSADATQHIVNETGLSTIFGAGPDLLRFVKLGEDATQGIKNIVSFDGLSQEFIAAAEDRFTLYDYWKEISSEQIKSHELELDSPSLKSIFTLSYTSGTTGLPKGVMVTNQNMIAALAGCAQALPSSNETDSVLSYLPLAHVFGRLAIYFLMLNGGSIGNFSGDVRKLSDDLQTLHPTIFPAVPRVLNRVFDAINKTVGQSNWVKRSLFKAAVKSKLEKVRKDGSVQSGFYDKVVFSKLKSKLGGKVKTIITGSAPIAAEVLQFFRIGFNCNVVEGYGQTESCGASFVTHNYENSTGHVGAPCVTCEYRLEDVPDLQYLHTDQPYPRGEVLIRGPCVFKGYFKQPEKTAETIDSNGWLHTGDIGAIIKGGALKIIDRKKNIFKLSQGEYLAPEKIERVYEKCSSIQQIFVYGDSLRSNVVAIIVADESELAKFAKENDMDLEDACKTPEFKKQIQGEMESLAKSAKLNSLEQVRGNFAIISTPWTENDLLTPTMKLKRHMAKDKYLDVINHLYDNA